MMIPVCDVLPAPLCDALNEINRFPVVIRLNWAANTRTHYCKRMLLLLLPANHDFPVIVTAQHQRHSSRWTDVGNYAAICASSIPIVLRRYMSSACSFNDTILDSGCRWRPITTKLSNYNLVICYYETSFATKFDRKIWSYICIKCYYLFVIAEMPDI